TGAEPWRIPNVADLPSIKVENAPASDKPGFRPYQRDPETLARPWAVPGTPGLEHRIGGLEKLDELGTVSYDPDNHHRMNLLRAEKVARVARDIPATELFGEATGDLLILGWGSTYGSIRSAVERLQARGKRVSHAHLRYLNPLPSDLENAGQLRMLIRAKYLVDAVGFNLVRGKPFQIGEIEAKAESLLGESVEAAK
ncbi:MAG: 2-oxoglutarate ferredoxin oxidoreductase subunit alpha, partial [bacterium]|nr:2-oxoglutarate ferredoxin oxidoreductase subunit alpha [Candidatus Aquidulcis frankliniae]